mgnify:FL=1
MCVLLCCYSTLDYIFVSEETAVRSTRLMDRVNTEQTEHTEKTEDPEHTCTETDTDTTDTCTDTDTNRDMDTHRNCTPENTTTRRRSSLDRVSVEGGGGAAVAGRGGPYPNTSWPSDHLLLMSTLEL